jgi:hypothetical protein
MMPGAEIALRTLRQEKVSEPCIAASWLMKGSYYSRVTGRNYWQDKEDTVLQALPSMGVNLCPQWAFPQDEAGNAGVISEMGEDWSNRLGFQDPEQILPLIEALPDDEAVERDFSVAAYAAQYARDIQSRMAATRSEVLFIGDYGQADFMSPYNAWGYSAYLMAIGLYPEYMRRYYHYTATLARMQNIAIVEAVRKYGLANFVYGGQDICTNQGPICSRAALDQIYFPELSRAIQPLLENDIRIIWHCDGNIMPILPRLIALGVHGLQGFQEESGVPYEQIVQQKSSSGDPLIVWGCVSVTTTLPFGSVEDVKSAVRRSFELAGPGRGFCLASTSSIMPEVPDENIDAFYRYGKTFGREFLSRG